MQAQNQVSVFVYAATIGSKCIYVGNTLHLERSSFKYWLCLLVELCWLVVPVSFFSADTVFMGVSTPFAELRLSALLSTPYYS